jgi:hypothetical protein
MDRFCSWSSSWKDVGWYYTAYRKHIRNSHRLFMALSSAFNLSHTECQQEVCLVTVAMLDNSSSDTRESEVLKTWQWMYWLMRLIFLIHRYILLLMCLKAYVTPARRYLIISPTYEIAEKDIHINCLSRTEFGHHLILPSFCRFQNPIRSNEPFPLFSIVRSTRMAPSITRSSARACNSQYVIILA